MAYNEESSGSGHEEPWIQWFCGLRGHEMFCEVERSYIEDGFNLYGLRACVANFSDCLDLILDRIGPDDSDDSHLTQSACTLYGLIHARYIITAHGLDAMYNKYAAKEFGTCPLIQCNGQPVLPVGLRDEMGADTVKIFCPKCQCVYHPPPLRSRGGHHSASSGAGGSGGGGSGAVDGAAFGTTFPHLFLMTFNNLVPDPLPADSTYVPRVFGFRVHQSARQRASTAVGSGGNQFSAAPSLQGIGVVRRTGGLSPVGGVGGPENADVVASEDVTVRTSQVGAAMKATGQAQVGSSLDSAERPREASHAGERDEDEDEKMPAVPPDSSVGGIRSRGFEKSPPEGPFRPDEMKILGTARMMQELGGSTNSAMGDRHEETAKRQRRRSSGDAMDDDAPDEDEEDEEEDGADSSKRTKRRFFGTSQTEETPKVAAGSSNGNGAKTKRMKRSGIGIT